MSEENKNVEQVEEVVVEAEIVEEKKGFLETAKKVVKSTPFKIGVTAVATIGVLALVYKEVDIPVVDDLVEGAADVLEEVGE